MGSEIGQHYHGQQMETGTYILRVKMGSNIVSKMVNGTWRVLHTS